MLLPAELRRHEHQVGIDREVHQRALLELEDQVVRIAVVLILPDRIPHALPRHGVLEFGSDDRDSVQADGQVERLGAGQLEQKLADDRQPVLRVERSHFRIHPVGRGEVGDLDRLAVTLETMPDYVERSARVHRLAQVVEQSLFGARPEQLFQFLPDVGLRVFDERNELGRIEGPLLVEKALVGLRVAGGCDQVMLNRRLEGPFLMIYWHRAAASCGR